MIAYSSSYTFLLETWHNLIKIIYNPRINNLCKILETPFVNDHKDSPYKQEIAMIKNKKFVDWLDEEGNIK